MTSKKLLAITPIRPDEEYIEFVKGLQLIGMGLDSASTTVDRSTLSNQAAGQNTPLDFHADFEVVESVDERLRTEGRFRLSINEDGSNKELVNISCTFSAMFRTVKRPTAEMCERFANTESKLVFWPYLRHFISDISYRMSITPILLPLTTGFGTSSVDNEKAKPSRKPTTKKPKSE